MAVVTIDKLTKIYDRGHAPAADNVSLDIADGEFMVLLGPSGCGKTTTLRMIAGLEFDLVRHGFDRRARRQPGAGQGSRHRHGVPILCALSAHEREGQPGVRPQAPSVDRAEIERRVANVAGILGLAELLGRKPHALSGGQRQRVALGRAIVRDPKVFLFDEPLSNLDAALRVSTRGEISALHRRLGATMIYVTHDQVEAMTMGTRICIMNGGRVAQVGPPLEVYRRPANTFVASFLGNPPMTLLPAVATDKSGGRCLKIGDSEIELPPGRCPPLRPGSQVTFGIRPEHVAQSAGREWRHDAGRSRDRSRGAARCRDDRDRAVAGRREADVCKTSRRRRLCHRRETAALSGLRDGARIRR